MKKLFNKVTQTKIVRSKFYKNLEFGVILYKNPCLLTFTQLITLVERVLIF